MKRCGECGWPSNADSASECEKCGASLGNASTPASPPASNPAPPISGGDGKKTVMGGGHNMPAWDGGSSSAPVSNQGGGNNDMKCSACGFYPLRATPSAGNPCPNCGFSGDGNAASEGGKPTIAGAGGTPQNLKKTQMFGQISFEDNKPKRFKLVENDNTERNFEGSKVAVGREQIDPENFSISSEHATFEQEDGKWYLSNQSSNGFTFIQVKGKVEVSDGDIIVIGNKIFQFKPE